MWIEFSSIFPCDQHPALHGCVSYPRRISVKILALLRLTGSQIAILIGRLVVGGCQGTVVDTVGARYTALVALMPLHVFATATSV